MDVSVREEGVVNFGGVSWEEKKVRESFGEEEEM